MCDECYGIYSGCPICHTQEPEYETCPECNGSGVVWYYEDKRINEKERDLFPEDDIAWDTCPRCHGTREVALDY